MLEPKADRSWREGIEREVERWWRLLEERAGMPADPVNPMLVFRDPGMRWRLARLRELGVRESSELPRGLPSAANALLEAPEGTAILLLEGES